MHTTSPAFEKAGAYLGTQISPPRSSGRPGGEAPQPFVTISRESGSGGSTLARLLATELNREHPAHASLPPWTVFDQHTVQHMLSSHDLPASLARFLPEDRVSEITSSVGEIVGLHPNLWDLVQRTNDFLRQVARRGRVILVGRGANFATKEFEGGLHIRLIAPVGHRDALMARVLQRPMREASAHNRQADAARRAYVRSVFNDDIADPTGYDLVINTAQVGLEHAAGLVASLIELRSPAPARAAV